MKPVAIPNRLAKRPTYRGLVIPYTTIILSNGEPDFTTNDEVRRLEVMRGNKCALCANPLDYWVYFIGGPKSHISRVFIDPATHEDCARYAMAVCPYLRNEHATYRDKTKSMADPTLNVRKDELMSPVRPPRMGLFKTRSFEMMRIGQQIIARATAWKSVEWF